MAMTVLIIICAVNLILGMFVLLNNSKAIYARLFFLFSFMICFWIASSFVTDHYVGDISINIITNKLAYISGYGVVLLGLLFTYLFPVRRRINTFGIIGIILTSIIMIYLSTTDLVAGSVNANISGGLTFLAGPLLGLYLSVILAFFILIARNLLILPKGSGSNHKVQARLILAAFLIGASIAVLLNVIIPLITDNWQTTQFGSAATVIFIGIIVYAITKRGLFDIRLAAVRILAYVLSLSTLSVVYYYLAFFISLLFFHDDINSSLSISPINIVLALLLAFIFQPIRKFFDKVTNKIFYRDNYSTDDFFARLNHTLSVTTDLRGLLERTAHEISETLKSEQAFFFINTSDDHYVSAGTQHHKQLPKDDAIKIGEYYATSSGVIIASLLNSNDPIRRLMLSHRIELILPLIQDDETIGYLCLGDHLTSGYTNRDVKALNTISSELIIAIQNALAVQEIKELNSTLQQRVNNATKELRASNAILRELDKVKDEFVSMASHQLRTPLTSVKGYLSMVIEGDAGKITGQQKQLLEEAFNSSERMVHLINDFLNVSRLQTGKFVIDRQPTDLSKVVQQEIEALQPSAASRNLEYIYNAPKKFPLLNVDEGKIRQVIMNFADNALYYSHENTKISVNLSVDGDNILFTVKDSGIGVPADEQKKLFTKFFRASNARGQRPDGTGVGIYLAKKVIEAHGGKIVFESVEGKGSTFGFRLPLKEIS